MRETNQKRKEKDLQGLKSALIDLFNSCSKIAILLKRIDLCEESNRFNIASAAWQACASGSTPGSIPAGIHLA